MRATPKKPRETRRKKILQTALEILPQRGFDGITLESIADALGYTKPAIYYYFKNKDDLVCSLITDYLKDAHQAICAITDGDGSPKERLIRIIHFYVDRNCEQRGYFTIDHHLGGVLRKMPHTAEADNLRKLSLEIPSRLIKLINEGIQLGEFRDEDPAVLGSLIFSLLGGVLTHMEMPSLASLGVEGLKQRVCDFALKGIVV